MNDRTIASSEAHRLQRPAMEPPRPWQPSDQRYVQILAPFYRNLRLERVECAPAHTSRLISCFFSRLISSRLYWPRLRSSMATRIRGLAAPGAFLGGLPVADGSENCG